MQVVGQRAINRQQRNARARFAPVPLSPPHRLSTAAGHGRGGGLGVEPVAAAPAIVGRRGGHTWPAALPLSRDD
jgi:hypothetical protein